jgi:hypothetical protein
MKRSIVAGILGVAVVAAMSLLGPPTAAHADSGFQFRNATDNKCLDADLSRENTDGDKIQVWDCWGGGNQLWHWGNCNINGCEVVNGDGQCLDADANHITSNGDTVQLWECTGGLNQYWTTGWPKPDFGHYQLVNAADGKCLDADANNINANGDTVMLWSCWYVGSFTVNGNGYFDPAPNQAWG